MTRLFTAQLATETNTFAPYPTGWATWRDMLYLERGEPSAPGSFDLTRPFVREAEKLGWQVEVGLRAFAQPAGRVPAPVYAELKGKLLADLKAAMPVDVVLLSLHGAMVAEGCHDCEGDLLTAARELVGPDVPIGAELDPHCHLTRTMVDAATILHLYKEYPHTDAAERGRELFHMIKDVMDGKSAPTAALHDPRMISMCHTSKEPMRGFVDGLFELEAQDGVLAVSIGHGFPWGDTPDMGTKVLVYTEQDTARAQTMARSLGDQLYQMRAELGPNDLSMAEAVSRALDAGAGPIVIADSADNPGGGAPCDSTYMLRELLAQDAEDFALGYLYDPQAARIAEEAGEGARLKLRIGGKICELSGEPMDLNVTVAKVIPDAAQTAFSSNKVSVGTAVRLELGRGRDLVLVTLRNQTFGRSLFEDLGIDLSRKRIVVVKSSQHFHADFRLIASDVLYTGGPGVVCNDFAASLKYEYADQSIWPLCES
ncbi:MAG: M81 family metallopeptidase [Gammaproteobacteria bacterium]|nr:M81 family metallopeptidase [Gammaproteobacteria bacterium]